MNLCNLFLGDRRFLSPGEMRILLTGISGQVGGALLPRLQGFGQVIAADKSVLDLVQLADILSTLDRFKPDLIINPAAYTAVDKAEDEPELALRVNGKGPAIVGHGPLFTACRSFISRPTMCSTELAIWLGAETTKLRRCRSRAAAN